MSKCIRGPLLALFISVWSTGCSTTRALVLYEVEYSSSPNFKNEADTDILVFRFGGPDEGGFMRDLATWEYSKDQIPQRGLVGGYMKVRSSVWVKWRSKADGQVHEVTAEFGNKLPRDMTNCRIFFTTYSNRLTVYLVTAERGDTFTDPDRMPSEAQQFKTVVLAESN